MHAMHAHSPRQTTSPNTYWHLSRCRRRGCSQASSRCTFVCDADTRTEAAACFVIRWSSCRCCVCVFVHNKHTKQMVKCVRALANDDNAINMSQEPLLFAALAALCTCRPGMDVRKSKCRVRTCDRTVRGLHTQLHIPARISGLGIVHAC